MNFLACSNSAEEGMPTSSSVIKEGDCVIVYEGVNSMKAVYVSAKGRFENRFGVFKHQSWIGKLFGSKVTASLGAGGWIFLLRPTPELWTQVLRHRTQILYLADISMVVMHLDLRPGGVVLESGTGSGSLTHSLVRAVAPAGHVHTFEFHAGRAEDAAAEFKQHGLSGLVTVAQRNIEELGFPDTLHGVADGVFLDLPGPHKVVPSAAACLKPNGRFCSFSPCIEQVQRTAEALSAAGFTDLITYECLLREYEVHRETLATCVPLAEGPQPKRHKPDPKPLGPTVQEAAGTAAGEASGTAEPAAANTVKAEETAEAEGKADGRTEEKAEEGASGAEEKAVEPSSSDVVGKDGNGKGATEPQQEAAEQRQVPAGKVPGSELRSGSGSAQSTEPMRIVSFRPSLEARGHTGYLIFARKFVCG